MDINVQIINNVKKYPQLYQRNSNVVERNRLWKILADSMKLEEQFLKSRWYILRERYTKQLLNGGQKRSLEKYSKEFDFLTEHITLTKAQAENKIETLSGDWIKPEFIITAEDLENDSEGEEIFFLTTEDDHMEEQHVEEVEQTVVLEEDIPFEQPIESEHEQEQMQVSQESQPEEQEVEHPSEDAETTNLEKNARNVLLQQDPEKKVIVEKIPIKKEEIFNSNEEAADQETQPANALATKPNDEEPVKKEVLQQSASQQSRCEDAIFGELVAAMLKTMESTKKKAVKKEIMNLLLT